MIITLLVLLLPLLLLLLLHTFFSRPQIMTIIANITILRAGTAPYTTSTSASHGSGVLIIFIISLAACCCARRSMPVGNRSGVLSSRLLREVEEARAQVGTTCRTGELYWHSQPFVPLRLRALCVHEFQQCLP